MNQSKTELKLKELENRIIKLENSQLPEVKDIQQEEKKDVGTLSNSLSGVQRSETALSLQIERSDSGVVDNHPLVEIEKEVIIESMENLKRKRGRPRKIKSIK